MSSDLRTSSDAGPAGAAATPPAAAPAPKGRRPPVSEDSSLAIEIRSLVERGEMEEARERFGELVAIHQRRASRIAFQYLRDAAETDEAVQDAFVKVFTHISTYRETWPFEVWFTRILVNGCLDRRKARARRDRWFVASDASTAGKRPVAVGRAPGADPERALLARERGATIAAAVDQLDGRQRTVFMLCHYGNCTPRAVSVLTGLKASALRVHLRR